MSFEQVAAGASSHKWLTLHEAADIVAMLAGIEPKSTTREIGEFPALVRDAVSWRRDLVERGMEDIAAVLESGMAALLGIKARGADPRPAALALWREFVEARSSLLSLLPPSAAAEPRD